MKPYQKPPMEAAVLPATEMMGRGPFHQPLRPPIPGGGGMRPPPPMYKGRPPPGMFGHHPSPSHTPMSSTSYPVPAPRSGTKMNKPTARYHPSLSGSETDVSTSTENLTQEEKFVLRHMERQEPQGEENGDPLNMMNPMIVGPPPPGLLGGPPNNMHGLGGHGPNNIHGMSQLEARHLAAASTGSGNNVIRQPRPPLTALDAHNMFPSLPRSLHEELLSQQQAKLRGLVPSSSPMLSPMVGGTAVSAVTQPPHPPPASIPAATLSAEAMLSKLTPSVYSHPTAVQDPVLKGRGPLEVTSSGAFFDHKSAPKSRDATIGSNSSSTDIIAKLTKEMMMSDTTTQNTTNNNNNSNNTNNINNSSNQNINTPTSTSTTSIAAPGPAVTSVSADNGHQQNLLNKLNLSPAKSRSSLAETEKDLETLRSSLAARKAAVAAATAAVQSPVRLSLIGTPLDKTKEDSIEALSRSQPDLFIGITEPSGIVLTSPIEDKKNPLYANTSELTMSNSTATVSAVTDVMLSNSVVTHGHSVTQPITHGMSATDLHQMETLKAENERLRFQLSDYTKKISRVASLEQEMAKIHQAYQSLLKHSEKRELLEKSARAKLQSVIINLSDANKEVTERHEAVMSQLMSGEPKNQNIPGLDAILRGEIMRKDTLIRQLMDQNKMLMTNKERQEVEMEAFKETLEEQRAHIQILDSALSNAHTNVQRLEEECRLKEGYAERVKQMTRSLDQLQKASEKREAMEKKLRAKLEDELKEFREAQLGNPDGIQRSGGGDSSEESRRKLSEAEEKIIRLESERTQWEQRYLEETAMRQVAIDAASIPKDAKIAALEKTSAESEKLIADARNDKMRQFEEMQTSQRKCAEMENAIKTLETTLAERNAAIRILQSKSQTSNHANINNIEELLAANKISMAGGLAVPHSAAAVAAAAAAAGVATPSSAAVSVSCQENILSIPIANSSPHKKQFSIPSVLATPPQYHSLNLSKHKLGVHHTHRSLTPSADMFLTSMRGSVTPAEAVAKHEQLLRSVTPSGTSLITGTPSDFVRANEALLRGTPTSAELHRFSAVPSSDVLNARAVAAHQSGTDLLRGTPTSMELLRATPTSAELLRQSSPSRAGGHQGHGHGGLVGAGGHGGPHIDASSAEILRANPELLKSIPSSVADMLRASAAAGAPPQSVMSSEPPRRREPSGTSEAFQHPGPTLINTADLYNPSLVGGTMPKMSMLREHKSPLSNPKFQSSNTGNVSGNSSTILDDSIGSFLGPNISSSSNIRHETSKSYDGSKSYMEVWRV